MMKFIRSRGAHVNAERLKLQKELFQFNQTLYHGFPHRPSALAYDRKLNLLAIGTREGSLRVYGRAGVEYYALVDQERKIDSIVFVENAAQLIIKCEDNSIHLYEIPSAPIIGENVFNSELILIKSFEHFVVDLENDEKATSNRITTLTVHSSNSRIFIATSEDGAIHLLNTKKFELEQNSIALDKVQSQLPAEQPRLLGAAEQILEHPLDSNLILIGYNRGQLVLWNLEQEKLEKFYSSGQQLESVCWASESGDEFISSHNDGSYIVWNINDNVQSSQQSKITYGPFPCKPINKIYGKSNENLIIFSGGMPRQLHGERHTVSVIQGVNDSAKHQVLDLTSKVIDFVVLEQSRALIILAEEELVAIDLNDAEWSQFKQPYLYSVHSSPITFSQIYSDISDLLMDRLKEIGAHQTGVKHSSREWPIQGGYLRERNYSPNNVLLITGHENGSVRIWNISDCSMSPLCSINTAKYFGTEDDIAPIDQDEQDDGDEWPPFKKVGVFDPYSDDPRLGIRKIVLCPKTFNLLVAGTAGQVIIFELKDEQNQLQLTRETIDLVSGLDFIWKSHECLPLETGLITVEAGYQPRSIVQLSPPASVTALALHTEWGLLSAGTTHGFAVFSYELNKSIAYKCTLNPAEVSNISGSGNLITRKKSFRKSLRESFRKLRKGRSMRLTKKAGDKSSPSTSPTKGLKSGLDSRPVERQVEAKTTEDGIGSVVRYLYFANAPIINQGQFQCTLWAGTNAGNVFIYLINDVVKEEAASDAKNSSTVSNEAASSSAVVTNNTSTTSDDDVKQQNTEQATASVATVEVKNNEIEESPIDDKTSTPNLSCILTKEIQLKHHAPVIFIQIVDSAGHPVELKPSDEQNEQHVRVLICSEEQFKLFNLPTLKPYCKFKLTAQEGAKSRRIHISKFISRSDSNYSENCIVNITNQGDVGIFSVLDLKKQMNSKCTKKEDVNGISSLVFANNGEGVYLNSPSEFSRFSLAAQRIVKPNCLISETNLENRIVIEVEKVAVEEVEQEKKANESKTNVEQQQLNQTNEATASSSNQQQNDDTTISTNNTEHVNSKNEKPKNAENQTHLPTAKVTEVKTKQQPAVANEPSPSSAINDQPVASNHHVVDNRVIDTVPKVVEEHVEVKLLETIRDCSVKQLCSTPEVVTEVKTIKSNGTTMSKQTNLVDVEVHHNGNGHHHPTSNPLVDEEDEGEGKSLEEDLLLDASEDNNQEKSNGTPTSGVVSILDEDSFADPLTDTASPILKENTEIKHPYSEAVKNKKWNNSKNECTDEIKNTTIESNSLIDQSFNLTSDITVDSIKEHFNNLSIRNDVDLLDHDNFN